jgi:hypothetical protein
VPANGQIPSYRCANCHWRTRGTPPKQCPVCLTSQFEERQPITKTQVLFVTTVCATYLVVTRIAGNVCDPFALIIEGCREGYLQVCFIGVVLCGILLPGMFWWVVYRRASSYVIAVISCLLWFGFCVYLRQIMDA